MIDDHGDRARRERDALLRLARDMASGAPSTGRVLRHLAETAQAFTAAEGACVLELREEVYRVVGPTGTTLPYDGQSFQIMPAPSLFREVLASRDVVVTNDGQRDPRVDLRFRDALNIQHLAVAPITVDNRIDGLLLVINSAQPDGFNADDAAFLRRLADFSGVALRDADLVRRADDAADEARAQATAAARSAQRSQVLARAAQVLATVETPEAVYAQLHELVHDLLRGGGFAIYDVDVPTRHVRLAFQAGVGQVDRERVADHFWAMRTGDVVLTGTPVLVSDMTRGTETELALTEPLRRDGVKSLAMLPLTIAGRTAGMLGIRFLEPWAFDGADRSFLEAFAAHVGQALRNSRHMDELEARARRLTTLAAAQQQLSGVLALEELPVAVLDAVRQVVPHVTACELCESDPDPAHSEIAKPSLSHAQDGELELRVPLSGTMTLCARTLDPSGFEPQDVDLLAILARNALQAFDTARILAAKDLERRRAEAAGAIARVALNSAGFDRSAQAILDVVERVAPGVGKALGVARARDGRLEYVVASGALASLVGYRPPGVQGVLGLSRDGAPVELATMRAQAPEAMRADIPDLPVLVLPLMARERAVGALVVVSDASPPWPPAMRETLERLCSSIALAIDAALLDEEERQARGRERMLATALMTLDHPVFIIENEEIRFANPSASREYGWPLAQLVGRRFEELVVSAPAAPSWHARPNVGRSDPEELDSVRAADPGAAHVHRRRDRSEFPAAVTVNPFRDANGTALGVVVSVRDLSTELALAEQMRHAEKMVALGELVAGVAHEINNPLTSISAFSELLLEDALSAEQRESAELIKRESERATAVIRDLLLFARKGEAPSGPMDLNELVEQTLRLRGYAHRASGLEVRMELAPDLPTVPGDSQRLQQVLLNLVTNAEHALAPDRMNGRGTRALTLRTHASGPWVFVTVIDTGCGMSATVKRRLFEPFFTTKPPGIGTGLGLSVSYGIMQAHGGSLDVESELDVGTRVTLGLPLRAPAR